MRFRLALALLLIVLATVALWAQVTGVRVQVQPGSPPVLSSLSVTTGQYGTAVTLTGTNFGSGQGNSGNSFVAFNGIAAPVTSWSDTSILVAVPAGATSGNVVVTVASGASTGIAFTVSGGAVGEQIYLAQAAAGGVTGANCANAKVYTFFNSATNWSATPNASDGKISPDDTVHICGTLTVATVGGNLFTFAGSGTSGHPVTLKAEPGAILTSPSWGVAGASGAITAAGVHDVVIDGANTGTIIATANGTLRANQRDSDGIFVGACTNCTVQGWTVTDIFVPAGSNPARFEAAGIMGGEGNHNVRFTGNTITNGYYGTWTTFNGDTNLEVDHNTITRENWGVGGGSARGGATVTGYLVHDNDISDGFVWEDAADNNHHNGIYIFAEQIGGVVNGLQIYNNYVHGNFGIHVTGWIFVSCQSGSVVNPLIYNNFLVSNTTASVPSPAYIMAWVDNPSIYNNTIVGSRTDNGPDGMESNNGIEVLACSSATGTVKNNIISTTLVGLYKASSGNFAASNNNLFFSTPGAVVVTATGGFFSTLASWTASSGQDAQSVSGNPLVNAATCLLTAGSPAIGTGANLSGLGITALNSDKLGVARGSSWNIGACQ